VNTDRCVSRSIRRRVREIVARAGRQTRSTELVRVERRALRFDELVERVRVEHLIQPLIERVSAGAR
jgi:hypothetical protein